MGISVLPVATSSAAPSAKSVTVPAINTFYKITTDISAGTYTLTTSPTSNQTTYRFYTSSSGDFVSHTTSSGTVTFTLSQAYTGAWVSIDSGSNVITTLTLVAANVSPTALSGGTVDTVTSTGTYNTTGLLYVMAVGGGGAGGAGTNQNNPFTGGGGGGSGGIATAFTYTNAAQSVTIGAAGGTTSFGNVVTAGAGSSGGSGPGGAGGPNGGAGGSGVTGANGALSSVIASAITSGTTGGGGGGPGGSGVGSGIGTGGHAGNRVNYSANAGNAGTGYGAGGGGGGARAHNGNNGGPGGAGSQGVMYILRGIS